MAGIPRYTKSLLYAEIENLRKYFGISLCNYPLNIKDICLAGGLEVNSRPFYTKGLQGMLTIDDEGFGYITLNDYHSPCEQNFYCGHEGLHFLLHRDAGQKSFQCFETVKRQQDRFAEWQANEGTAEWLIPYRKFIPEFLACYSPLSPTPDINRVREYLAANYFVSERVIYMRIENLKYEIWQVANGVPLNEVELISDYQQRKREIYAPSCNVLGAFADSIQA